MTDERESFLVNFSPVKPSLLQKSAGNLPLFREVRLKDHATVMDILAKILRRLICIYIEAYNNINNICRLH